MTMLFITSALLALAAFKVTAYPHPETTSTHHLELSNPKRGATHHIEPSSNMTLIPRAEKGICPTLELPTEASYKIGYEDFCKKYITTEHSIRMSPGEDPLVATYKLKTYTGNEIQWIFKISTLAWGSSLYFLTRDMCFIGFKEMLEGDRAEAGYNYCVVDGSGGNGQSKKQSGQGDVLILGHKMTWGVGDVNNVSEFETRRRKGT